MAETKKKIDISAGLVRRDKLSSHAKKASAPKQQLEKLGRAASNELQPVGEKEAETGREILHVTDNPAALERAAAAAAPELEARLKNAIKGVAGARFDAVRPSKKPHRLVEKIQEEEQPAETVPDYLASRVIVDSPAAKDSAVAGIRKEFPVVREKNLFEKGDKDYGYRHHALQVQMPSGVSAEVHVVPKEVADINADEHENYKTAREAALRGDKTTFRVAAAVAKGKNDAAMKKFNERNRTQSKGETAEPKFDFGSTQTNIPPDSDAAKGLASAQKQISPEDLHPASGLESEPHVTLRYGVRGDDTSGIEKYLRGQSPFEARLGKTSTFPPSQNSDGAAVIKADVHSPELHRMNAEIEQHGDFKKSDFPEYIPHATVSYVKPETAQKYVGMPDTDGKSFTVRSIAISDRNGGQREIPLQGDMSKLGPGVQVTVHGRSEVPDGTVATLHHWNDRTDGRGDRTPRGRATAALPDGSSKRLDSLTPDQVRPVGAAGGEWIGVDLDGTLAHYDGYKGPTVIGVPIPAMVTRVKRWLAEGKDVRIFTARISEDPQGMAKAAIDRWSERNLGQVLPITNKKDAKMGQLWDDRAVQVRRNHGEPLGDPEEAANHADTGASKPSQSSPPARSPEDRVRKLRDAMVGPKPKPASPEKSVHPLELYIRAGRATKSDLWKAVRAGDMSPREAGQIHSNLQAAPAR